MERVDQVRVIATVREAGAGPRAEADPEAPGPDRRWVQARRPSLAMRVAVLTFLVIVGLPVLILFGFAAAAAAVVFGGLALLTAARRRIKAALPGDDGRENVRVRRDET